MFVLLGGSKLKVVLRMTLFSVEKTLKMLKELEVLFVNIMRRENCFLMRIMKLVKYRLKTQVEKDEGPSGEGQSPRVEKDEGPSGEG